VIIVVRPKPLLDKTDLKYMTECSERAIKRYPKLAELYTRLAPAGGTYFFIDPNDTDYWIDRLLNKGEWIYPDYVSYAISRKCKLEPLQCYANLTKVYPPKRVNRKVRIYMGYSLMQPEDLWLQHVWMFDGKTVHESTPVKSSRYFGIPVDYYEFVAWMEDYRWRLPRDPNWVDE